MASGDIIARGSSRIAQGIRDQSLRTQQGISDLFKSFEVNEQKRNAGRSLIKSDPYIGDDDRVELLSRFDDGNKKQRDEIISDLTTNQAVQSRILDQGIKQQRAQTEGIKARTALTTAEANKNKIQSELKFQAGISGVLQDIQEAKAIQSKGGVLDPNQQRLLNNTDLVELSDVAAVTPGFVPSKSLFEEAIKKDDDTVFKTVPIDGENVTGMFSKNTGELINPNSALRSPIRTAGVQSPRDKRIERREDASFDQTNEIIDKGSNSRDRLNSLRGMKGLLEGGLQTGFGQGFLNTLGKAGRRFGFFKDVESIDDAQTFLNIQGDLLAERFDQTKGSISEAEVKLFEASIPNLKGTPEGNLKLINFLIAAEERALNISNEAKRLRGPKLDLTDQEVQAKLDEFASRPEFNISNILTQDDPNVKPGEFVGGDPVGKFEDALNQGITDITIDGKAGKLGREGDMLIFVDQDGNSFQVK